MCAGGSHTLLSRGQFFKACRDARLFSEGLSPAVLCQIFHGQACRTLPLRSAQAEVVLAHNTARLVFCLRHLCQSLYFTPPAVASLCTSHHLLLLKCALAPGTEISPRARAAAQLRRRCGAPDRDRVRGSRRGGRGGRAPRALARCRFPGCGTVCCLVSIYSGRSMVHVHKLFAMYIHPNPPYCT